MTTTDIINEAKLRHQNLDSYDFDWVPFYNGYVEGRVAGIPFMKKARTLIADMLSVYAEDKTNIVTDERLETWQEKFKELNNN
ncbi:hypothetical protein UFOVP745_31 [uncultured Caudovirales phage]|uniref:Uncharacterized protein n=1 Tax=uncultured Caudovirales phage TaxID=2100421 RepID=A0A6J7X710_9CAUD|nr:hypothetical protein UFOVP745_31 [uncultured Caudovirales phage]